MSLLEKLNDFVEKTKDDRLCDKIVFSVFLDKTFGLNGPTNRELAFELFELWEEISHIQEGILDALAAFELEPPLWDDLSKKAYSKKGNKKNGK
jgi:hypothetical protein